MRLRLIVLCVMVLAGGPAGGAVPPLVAVVDPFGVEHAECLAYECAFTQGGGESCYETGEVIYAGPACQATCDFGDWRVDCS